jgi:polyhydroxyalkanoate synthesis regulator protein
LSGNPGKPFAGMQAPAVQHMISGYMEQSQKAVAQMQAQMQEHMNRHTEQMLAAIGLKR